MTTRTTVELEKIGLLLDGRYENPFELLGPHEVMASGRRAMAVRAFLPGSAQAWVVEPAARSSAADAVHPSGRIL